MAYSMNRTIQGATVDPLQRSAVQENNTHTSRSTRSTAEQIERGTRLLTGNSACPPVDLSSRRAAGFSLVEILLSLGIFAIGMTAIVSLFPAAAIIQRETTQEVIGGMAAQSAASIIDTQALTYEWSGTASTGDLAGYYSATGYNDTDVVPLYVVSSALMTARYPFTDRSYPSGVINRAPFGTVATTDDASSIADCDLHWVPFIQDLNGEPAGTNQNWVVRLFILEADSRATYSGGIANPSDPNTFPRVTSVGLSAVSGSVFTTASALDLDPGDIVMDSNGNSHVITNISGSTITVLNSIAVTPNTPNKLWYAPKSGASSSPAQRVVTVEVNVVAP